MKKASTPGYIKKEEASQVAITYVPSHFPMRIKREASAFVSSQKIHSNDFAVDHLVAEQSGIAHLNQKKLEEQVEAEALEKLKTIQENAYKEAYELGVIEGTEKAFNEQKEELTARIVKLDEMLGAFENIKVDLIAKNELQIMQLVSLIASKIAMAEIKGHQELIIGVIKKVIEIAQSEEEVNLLVSMDDFMFIESLRERSKKDMSFLKRVKVEVSDDVESGGCILETKYGAIDARLEQRFNAVWDAIQRKMPHLKPELFSEEARTPSEDEVLKVKAHLDKDEVVEKDENLEGPNSDENDKESGEES